MSPEDAASADSVWSAGEERHIVGILTSVERDAYVSQRRMASDLGVALGLTNSYVKRCVKKGLMKVHHLPPRRFAYFLTPKGLAEKSRLTAEYLYESLSLFRQARIQCEDVFQVARSRGWRRVALIGGSEVAEIAVLCTAEYGLQIVAIVDSGMRKSSHLGIRVFAGIDDIADLVDGVVVTGIYEAQALYEAAVERLSSERVLVPATLSVRTVSVSAQNISADGSLR